MDDGRITEPPRDAGHDERVSVSVFTGRARLGGKASPFAVYASYAVGEFNALASGPNAVKDGSLVERGRALCKTVGGQLAASDQAKESIWRADDYDAVFELDRLTLRLMSLEQIKLRSFALFERFRSLFSSSELERITRVMDRMESPERRGVDKDDRAEETIRAQADEVLASLHWYLLFSRARDRRIHQLMRIAVTAICALTALALVLLVCKLVGQTDLYAQVASFLVFLVMGGLGAATSVAWRLQGLLVAPPTLPHTHLTDLGGLKYGVPSLFVSIGCGVVFAFVLYMLFAGGVVVGSLFPEVATPPTKVETGLSLSKFFSETGPRTGMDYAKLLTWLFLSGFAEKFVPDVLERISKGSQPGAERK